jgi:hypothetical protein
MQQILPWLFMLVGIVALAYIGLAAPARTGSSPKGEERDGDVQHSVKPRETEGGDATAPRSQPAQLVQIGITLLILGSALFIILSKGYADAEQKWAFGAVGTILGYWLKR